MATRSLPENCVGCGAYSHTTIPGEPGYFDLERKNVKEYLGIASAPEPKRRPKTEEDDVVQKALKGLDLDELARSGVDLMSMLPPKTIVTSAVKTPLCDRCHNLKFYNNAGTQLHHPELDDIIDTIQASPYKYNHIYHVLDAADFPMSLLPKLRSVLELMPLRSQNRRSHGGKFHRGRKMELSFIITRSDLLGHSKEKVDSLMPYLREVLRDRLGRLGKNVRLGNVRCVSAKRNWWTTELRNEILERGGAGWMVGKVNVGKSALFSEVFPKGHSSPETPPKHHITVKTTRRFKEEEGREEENPRNQLMPDSERSPAEGALLPATRQETNYPVMPVHSPVPGTTAAPIRIPFGNGKGELIDLPGISRGDLSTHVKEDKRDTLIMTQRPWPGEEKLPLGRSLLLGGFIRITPQTPNVQILAANFTPLEAHAAQTAKCIAVQEQKDDAPHIENISQLGTGTKIKSAGVFPLKYDVTTQRAGSVVRAMKQKKDIHGNQRAVLDKLPFRVLGVDILIEGVGWVEIVAQVRKRDFPDAVDASLVVAGQRTTQKKAVEKDKTTWGKNGLLQTLDLSPGPDQAGPEDGRAKSVQESFEEDFGEEEPESEWEDVGKEEKEAEAEGDAVSAAEESIWPVVEVFTPEGNFVSSRRPMNAFLMNKPVDKRYQKRQRKSMKGVDKARRKKLRADFRGSV